VQYQKFRDLTNGKVFTVEQNGDQSRKCINVLYKAFMVLKGFTGFGAG